MESFAFGDGVALHSAYALLALHSLLSFLVFGLLIKSVMDVLDIFRLVLSIEHGIRPEDVLFDLVGLNHSSHFFYLIVLFLAEGQLIFEEAIDTPQAFLSRINNWFKGTLFHLILFDLFLELLKLLLAVHFVIIACLPFVVMIVSIEAQLLIQDLLILILHLVHCIVLGDIFLEGA